MISKEQRDEIMDYVRNEHGYRSDLAQMLSNDLDSLVKKEYKCPCCGETTVHNSNCMFECRTTNQFDDWSCYQDDWNGGVV